MHCALERRGAAFLRSPERGREYKPGACNRNADERNRAQLQPERLQAVEHPAVQRIRPAIDDDVDQVLGRS